MVFKQTLNDKVGKKTLCHTNYKEFHEVKISKRTLCKKQYPSILLLRSIGVEYG